MHFAFSLALIATLALVIYNVISYLHATGTVWDRLAYAWKGSMTIFTLIWTFVVSCMVSGANFMSAITGDPQFSAIGNAIKEAAGPIWAPWIGIATLALPLVLGAVARNRTLSK